MGASMSKIKRPILPLHMQPGINGKAIEVVLDNEDQLYNKLFFQYQADKVHTYTAKELSALKMTVPELLMQAAEKGGVFRHGNYWYPFSIVYIPVDDINLNPSGIDRCSVRLAFSFPIQAMDEYEAYLRIGMHYAGEIEETLLEWYNSIPPFLMMESIVDSLNLLKNKRKILDKRLRLACFYRN